MSVDEKTIRHIAALSRIAIPDNEVKELSNELNTILAFIEALNEVDTDNIKPMTGAVETALVWRDDVVNDGGYADKILANAPQSDAGYFVVPKVVE